MLADGVRHRAARYGWLTIDLEGRCCDATLGTYRMSPPGEGPAPVPVRTGKPPLGYQQPANGGQARGRYLSHMEALIKRVGGA